MQHALHLGRRSDPLDSRRFSERKLNKQGLWTLHIARFLAGRINKSSVRVTTMVSAERPCMVKHWVE